MSRPAFQERHMDYVLGPNQDGRLSSVAAGAIIEGLALPLEQDAPFVLRSRAHRVKYNAARQQAGLQFLSMRYSGPSRDFRSTVRIPQAIEGAYFGQVGLPIPIQRQIVYPASGVIYVDVQNTGSAAMTNLTLYFRGVKLYPWGLVPSFTYPPRFADLPFCYPQTVTALPVTTPSMGVRTVFTVKDDADFVLRAIQAGRSFTPQTWEVFIRLFDAQEKPYSNDFVHVDVMCGQLNGNPTAAFPSGGTPTYYQAIGAGPSAPGLLYPEIYVPRNQILYYDVLRTDVSFGGAVAADFPINFIGCKVFGK